MKRKIAIILLMMLFEMAVFQRVYAKYIFEHTIIIADVSIKANDVIKIETTDIQATGGVEVVQFDGIITEEENEEKQKDKDIEWENELNLNEEKSENIVINVETGQ